MLSLVTLTRLSVVAASSMASYFPSNNAMASNESAVPQQPQLALLDFFVPGFSVFAAAVRGYLGIDFNTYLSLILLACAFTFSWNYVTQYFFSQVESHFMSVVDIRTDDEIYNILMVWVSKQSFSQSARRFIVNTTIGSRWSYLWRYDYDDDDEEELDGDRRKKKKGISYTPAFGSHYFFYKGRLLLFRRTVNREQGSYMLVSDREEISVSCFGRNPWVLKELLHEARQQYIKKDEERTLIYRGASKSGSLEPTWQRCIARVTRPFSTVILNDKVKQDLINDVTDYLSPSTQRWYANRGIPYRRGYLLHGPPGTGKSSLSLALAGFFKMRIYIVSLSSVTANEENLATLFSELPRACVVLLEDIDTAGLTHTREENQPLLLTKDASSDSDNDSDNGSGTAGVGVNMPAQPQIPGRLSLSGLLNILDGVASQEGRVLIMTTNHLEKLDKALIRPGRVDMIVNFGLADRDMIAAIFRAIFSHLEGDDGPEPAEKLELEADARQAYLDEKAKKKADVDARAEALAGEFAAKVPAHEFSPAELQGYLMRHKRNAEAAVANVDEFVETTRRDRKEKELKEAEKKRKAEEAKKEEEEKKKEKEKAEEEDKKKKVEEEGKKKAEEDKRAGQTEESEQEDTTSGSKPTETATVAEHTNTQTMAEASPNPEALEGTTKEESDHMKPDSGYVTPTTDDH